MDINIISDSIVQTSEHFRNQYTLIVEYCVQLRKEAEMSILSLSKDLEIDRRKLSNFEKLKIFDMALSSNIMEYFNDEITFLRKKRHCRNHKY